MDVAERDFTAWATAAWPRLLRTATALTAGDHHLAEDLVQSALAKTFAVWGRVRSDEARGLDRGGAGEGPVGGPAGVVQRPGGRGQPRPALARRARERAGDR